MSIIQRNWEELRFSPIGNMPWSDYADIQKEAKRIRKIRSTTADIIKDALTRYTKKKINARNKKEAEDMKLRFRDLELYDSERDIQDAYGIGCITEKEYDRLLELFHLREEVIDANGKFSDGVTELLDRALDAVYSENADFFSCCGKNEKRA